jgi:hypothetical protein
MLIAFMENSSSDANPTNQNKIELAFPRYDEDSE